MFFNIQNVDFIKQSIKMTNKTDNNIIKESATDFDLQISKLAKEFREVCDYKNPASDDEIVKIMLAKTNQLMDKIYESGKAEMFREYLKNESQTKK